MANQASFGPSRFVDSLKFIGVTFRGNSLTAKTVTPKELPHAYF